MAIILSFYEDNFECVNVDEESILEYLVYLMKKK